MTLDSHAVSAGWDTQLTAGNVPLVFPDNIRRYHWLSKHFPVASISMHKQLLPPRQSRDTPPGTRGALHASRSSTQRAAVTWRLAHRFDDQEPCLQASQHSQESRLTAMLSLLHLSASKSHADEPFGRQGFTALHWGLFFPTSAFDNAQGNNTFSCSRHARAPRLFDKMETSQL